MRTVRTIFLTAMLLGASGLVVAQEAPPPEPAIGFTEDGGIERGEIVVRYWQVNHEQPTILST